MSGVLDDPRLQRRKIPWSSLLAEGVDPKEVMHQAQRRRDWRVAESARRCWHRVRDQQNRGEK
jgi:hypothetical protein